MTVDRSWILPAIQVLEENEWIKGQWYKGLIKQDHSVEHCFCTLGAIIRAECMDASLPFETRLYDHYVWVDRDENRETPVHEIFQYIGRLEELTDLAQWLQWNRGRSDNRGLFRFESAHPTDDDYAYNVIFRWNDSIDRTKEDVIETLKEYANAH